MVAQSICISKAVINSWGTVIITHNTVVMKWQPAVLYKDNNSSKKCTWERKMKDKMMKLGAISNDLPLSISVPHISLLLSPRVCPFISPSLAVAFASCTSACFIAETITDGLCVRCKGWHWGRSQDPRVRGGYQSPSRGIMNHRGEAGGSRSNAGTALGSSGSWHALRLVLRGAAYKMNKRPDKCLACDREEIKAPIA